MKNLIKASRSDKNRVIEILCRSFEHDPQITWMIGEEKGKNKRLRVLMEFAFELGHANQEVYLSPGKNAVAIWKMPDKKAMTLTLFWLYLKFIGIMGISRVLRISKMEESIGRRYPQDQPYTYLWLLAVDPDHQGRGLSSQMLKPALSQMEKEEVPVYLETTNPRNLPIYQKKGFRVYDQMELEGEKKVQVYFMRKSTDVKTPQAA